MNPILLPLLMSALSGENTPDWLQGTGINTNSPMGVFGALLSGRWIPNVIDRFRGNIGDTVAAGPSQRTNAFPEARF